MDQALRKIRVAIISSQYRGSASMAVHIFAVLAVQLRSLLCFFHVEVGQLLLDKARLRRIIAHALPAVEIVRRLIILGEPLLLRHLLSIRPLLLGRYNDSILTSIY